MFTTIKHYASPAPEDHVLLYAGAGRLDEMFVKLVAAATSNRTLMFFDADSLPDPNTVPLWRVPVTGASGGGWAFPQGYQFSTGLYLALSSDEDDLTVTSASEGLFQATWLQ